MTRVLELLTGLAGRLAGRRRTGRDDRAARALQSVRASSDARANRLLRHLLDPRQRTQFDRHGCFTVEVEGRGTFAVLPQLVFGVVDLSSGVSYCCVTETPVPMGDHMLIQKLLLESDAERFFAVARSQIDCGPQDPRVARFLAAIAEPV